jgi:hypothetical protein
MVICASVNAIGLKLLTQMERALDVPSLHLTASMAFSMLPHAPALLDLIQNQLSATMAVSWCPYRGVKEMGLPNANVRPLGQVKHAASAASLLPLVAMVALWTRKTVSATV